MLIKQQTGIWIIPTTIRIDQMEIAFTFATDAIIHFQTRNLLLRSLSNTSQVNKKVYTGCSTPEDHHILSSKKMKTCCMFFTIKQQKQNIINRLN